MTFEQALTQLKAGIRVKRAGWAWWVALIQAPNGDMSVPFFCTKLAPGQVVPWTPTQVDLLATDWEVFV